MSILKNLNMLKTWTFPRKKTAILSGASKIFGPSFFEAALVSLVRFLLHQTLNGTTEF
jgi:hypothetical protein